MCSDSITLLVLAGKTVSGLDARGCVSCVLFGEILEAKNGRAYYVDEENP